MQGIFPMIAYADGQAAMDWLARAFGFVEVTRMLGENGRLAHGEMETGTGMIMLAEPSPDYEGPRKHREQCAQAARWSSVPWIVDGVLVYVNDVTLHFERARSAGANILSEVEDGGPGKRYRVEDIEGHRWMFMGDITMTTPDYYQPIMPYLVLKSADGFIEFVETVFGAEEKMVVRDKDGSIMHAELSINGGTILLMRSRRQLAALSRSDVSAGQRVDERNKRAIENGADGNMEPQDKEYGRAAGFKDKWGDQWWHNSPG